MSTLEGLIQSLSIILTNDLVANVHDAATGRQLSDRFLFLLNRAVIAALALLSFALAWWQLVAPNLSVILFAQLGVYAYFAAAFVPVLFGTFLDDVPLAGGRLGHRGGPAGPLRPLLHRRSTGSRTTRAWRSRTRGSPPPWAWWRRRWWVGWCTWWGGRAPTGAVDLRQQNQRSSARGESRPVVALRAGGATGSPKVVPSRRRWSGLSSRGRRSRCATGRLGPLVRRRGSDAQGPGSPLPPRRRCHLDPPTSTRLSSRLRSIRVR